MVIVIAIGQDLFFILNSLGWEPRTAGSSPWGGSSKHAGLFVCSQKNGGMKVCFLLAVLLPSLKPAVVCANSLTCDMFPASTTWYMQFLASPLFVLSGPPQHVCRGCCADRAESVQKAAELVGETVFKAMTVPAMNKWTKIFPAAAQCVLLAQLFGLGPAAFKAEFESQALRVSDSSSEEAQQDRDTQVPVNEIAKWRKLARRRNARALHFLTDKQCSFVNFAWLILAEPAMRIHWSLFKHATWYSDRGTAQEAGGQQVPKQVLIDDFCLEEASSPALRVVQDVMRLMKHPSESLALLVHVYGPFERWSLNRKKTVRRAAVIMLGQIFRKLVFPWRQYPWRLCQLVAGSEEQQKRCAEDLLAAEECCLDTFFSAKLQRDRPSVDQLTDPQFQASLRVVFDRVVLTSTFIERQFASFSRWTGSQVGCTLPALAAKHVTRLHKEIVDRWRAKSAAPGRKKTNLKRPVWSQQRKVQTTGRLNGYHMFVREYRERRGDVDFLHRVRAAWDNLTADERARYSALAMAANAGKRERARENEQAAAAVENLEQQDWGPWRLVQHEDPWPMAGTVLQDYLAANKGFSPAKKKWCQETYFSPDI